jgi:hypothetical protein
VGISFYNRSLRSSLRKHPTQNTEPPFLRAEGPPFDSLGWSELCERRPRKSVPKISRGLKGRNQQPQACCCHVPRFQRGLISLRLVTWGSARCASPQAVTFRAFSPDGASYNAAQVVGRVFVRHNIAGIAQHKLFLLSDPPESQYFVDVQIMRCSRDHWCRSLFMFAKVFPGAGSR